MPRDVILGTAGHIDHGKTALVAALTGTRLDRRPEEQRRGITIDLGFARLDLGPFRCGLVDVPGHEKFVGNMLAGVAGIEVALLVVAADDGVMPQTREHLAILDLLGVRAGVVALTKSDLADDATREVAALEVRELLAGTTLQDAAIVPVSAKTGAGLDELRAALLRACESLGDAGEWPFRLGIDRAFSVAGHGSVVTGSAVSGTLSANAELDWHAGGGRVERVRVRGLSNHGEACDSAGRGQRVAINIAGVPVESLGRGQDLGAAGTLVPTRVLTVAVSCWAGAPRPLRHRHRLRLHLGTADVAATLSLSDCDQARPGSRAFGQLFLAEPLTPAAGQPFVLRADSAEETLGGGRVLHPGLPRLRRRNLAALEQLERLASPDAAERAAACAYFAGNAGLDPRDLPRLGAVPPGDIAAVIHELSNRGEVIELGGQLLHAARVERLEASLVDELQRRHDANPLMTNHDRSSVLASLPDAPPAVLAAVASRLVGRKLIVGDARRLARADFRPKLSHAQRKLKDKLAADFAAAGLNPPDPSVYLPQVQHKSQVLADVFEVAVAEGILARVGPEFYLARESLDWAVAELRRRLTAAATVGDIRDWLGTTRKFAIPLCEYLDKIGVTVRDGDARRLATEAD